MAISGAGTSETVKVAPGDNTSYGSALAMVTTLFFMWGFLTSLNDILIPHLKSIFELNYTEVMLVQFAFFGTYAALGIASGKIVEWIGYKRTMVVGLLTMGVGAVLFIPAAKVPSYPLFLGALIVLAAGITALQVAANPYVSVLGPPRTASSRLAPQLHVRPIQHGHRQHDGRRHREDPTHSNLEALTDRDDGEIESGREQDADPIHQVHGADHPPLFVGRRTDLHDYG